MNNARVVLAGRMNVGKSTLFNRLASHVRSLTYNEPGVTRDMVHDTVKWQGKSFEIIDIGGITTRSVQGVIDIEVQKRARAELSKGTVILFMVDGSVGLLPEDQDIARELRKYNIPVIVVVNKSDVRVAQENSLEFMQLGFNDLVLISAQHGTGLEDLLEQILRYVPEKEMGKISEESPCRVVLLGKPNVGKSSLMNILLKHERSLVTPVAGTTREAISEKINFYKESLVLTDTAGVRRKRAIEDPLEQLMVHSTFMAVKQADIILLLIDGSAGALVDQELKLAFYAFEQGKAVIILRNKEDLITPLLETDFKYAAEQYHYFLSHVHVLTISCITGHNVGKIVPLISEVWQAYTQKFNDIDLSVMLKNAVEKVPLYRNREKLELYGARQQRSRPITIVVRVNYPRYFEESQKNFLERVMREHYDLKSVPILFIPQKR